VKIQSSLAFIVYAVLMVAAYVWATVNPTAPFEVFAWAFTGGFGAYLGKRLVQKKASFGANGMNGDGGGSCRGVVGGGE